MNHVEFQNLPEKGMIDCECCVCTQQPFTVGSQATYAVLLGLAMREPDKRHDIVDEKCTSLDSAQKVI